MMPRPIIFFALLSALILAVSCASREPQAKVVPQERIVDPWSAEFSPPRELDTPWIHLEPLDPRHTPLDFAAFMSCREFIRESLHWGSWPRPDMTLERNLADLEGHAQNFINHKQYTYTVMTADRSRVVGCIYMDPVRGNPASPRRMDLAWWVSKSELGRDLDRHLLGAVLCWLRSDFPFDVVEIRNAKNYARGRMLLSELGLALDSRKEPNHDIYIWTR